MTHKKGKAEHFCTHLELINNAQHQFSSFMNPQVIKISSIDFLSAKKQLSHFQLFQAYTLKFTHDENIFSPRHELRKPYNSLISTTNCRVFRVHQSITLLGEIESNIKRIHLMYIYIIYGRR